MEARELEVIITANTTSFEKGMATIKAASIEAAGHATNLGNSFKSIGSNLSSIGSSLTTNVTLPIVAIGAAAVKMASDFQTQMTFIRTQAGDTTDSISDLSKQVLDLAHSSAFGPEELAKGLYHLVSLGLRGAEAMHGLDIAQQMAAVGGAKLEETTSALGAAMVSGISGTEDLGKAAGNLNAIVGQGNMRMEDLIGALGSGILPVAKNAGLTLTDVGAALATLTDNGMGADESATRLRMTFASMEAPSQKAQKVLESIGMSASQWALDMRQKGLIPALTELRDHLEKTYGTTDEGKTRMASALTEIFGGGRSSAAAQTLINELDRMQNKFNAISQGGSEFSRNVGDTMQTAGAKMHVAWSAIQADLIQLGDKLLPIVAKAMDGVAKEANNLSQWWNKLSSSQQDTILKIIGFIALAGPILAMIGSIISIITTLAAVLGTAAGPWVLLGIAVVTVLGIIIANWGTIVGFFNRVWGSVVDTFNLAVKNISKAVEGIWGSIVGTLNGIYNNMVHWASSVLDGVVGFFRNIPGEIAKAITGANNAASSIGSAADRINAALSNTGKIPLPHFAEGVSNFRGGLAVVGERGPELVHLPAGSSVIPNNKIGNNHSITVNITGDFRGQTQKDMNDFGSILTNQLRLAARGF